MDYIFHDGRILGSLAKSSISFKRFPIGVANFLTIRELSVFDRQNMAEIGGLNNAIQMRLAAVSRLL